MTVQIAARGLLVAVLLVSAGGCFVDFEPGDTVFACTNDESCASTHQCVEDACVPRPEQEGPDGGSGGTGDLVAEYLFNASLDDSSGNGHHAVTYLDTDAASTTYTDGVEGGASLSIGTDNEAKVDYSSISLDVLTVEVWVRPASDSSTRTIIEAPSFTLGLTIGGGVTCSIMGAAGASVEEGGLALAGDWTHILCMYDPSVGTRLWVDGTYLGTGSQAGALASGAPGSIMSIGRSENSVAFNGEIDVLRLWDRTLSPDEIAASAGIEGQ